MLQSEASLIDERAEAVFTAADYFAARRGILWLHASACDTTARPLADPFRGHFKKYESGVNAEIPSAGAA